MRGQDRRSGSCDSLDDGPRLKSRKARIDDLFSEMPTNHLLDTDARITFKQESLPDAASMTAEFARSVEPIVRTLGMSMSILPYPAGDWLHRGPDTCKSFSSQTSCIDIASER